ncbi:MAG: HEAT repeat domain-containing protein [Nitrospira sp.]|nr:HEAT repeat domain-containing protein [Nitrospira sp.]
MNDREEIESTIKMIADHMETGFLENIVAMFKQDKSYYPHIGDLMGDERMQVRIGTFALVETLMAEDLESVISTIPGIAKLLSDENPTIRGDAAHLLGIIGHKDALPFLSAVSDEESDLVRETIEEAIEEIKENEGS